MSSSLPRVAQATLMELDNLRASTGASIPLYHYSDSSGTLGILGKNEIWASNARYLNDSTELNLACDIVHEIAEDLLKNRNDKLNPDPLYRMSESESAVGELLLRLMHLLRSSEFNPNFDAYIACFCTNNDLLSQWRGYASNSGYNIGIDSNLLYEQSISKYSSTIVSFGKVDYDHVVWIEKITLLINQLIESIKDRVARTGAGIKEKLAEQYSVSVADCVTRSAPFIKHDGFREEDEWRMAIFPNSGMDEYSLRASPNGMIPYIKLPLGKSVVSVCVGPRQDQKLQMRALELLKFDHEVKIVKSVLPFRA